MKIPFAPPYIDDEIIENVVDSLRSGWITTGPKVAELERKMSEYLHGIPALCVGSASAGMQLMLEWWGIEPGDEVIIPAYTYASTATAVLHCGAKPVMVDVGSDFTMDVHQLSLLITEKTKAIIPVDIGGWPCHYDAIFSIIQLPENLKKFSPNNEHQRKLGRILILSDAAHSFGSWYQNRKIGSISDVTVVSLHAVKNITSAEGGVVFINLPAPFDNRQIYQENKIITQNGHSKNVHEKSLADGWKYDIVSLGKKINMTDLGAAIALAQLNKYDDLLKEERFRVFQRYSEKLKEYDWALLPLWEDEHRKSNGHLFMLRVDGITEQHRDQIIHQLKDQEISTNVHFIPLPLFSYFKTIGYDIQHFPRALALYQQEISLPIYPQLSNEMIDFLVNQLILAVQKVQLND